MRAEAHFGFSLDSLGYKENVHFELAKKEHLDKRAGKAARPSKDNSFVSLGIPGTQGPLSLPHRASPSALALLFVDRSTWSKVDLWPPLHPSA